MILCDAAQSAPDGKLHILGAGWSQTGSPTAPMALAVMVKVPWDRANQKIKMAFSLLDADGSPVVLPTPLGPKTLGSEAEMEVGRPAGLPHGSSIDASFALNVGSLPLQPGRYEWRLLIGGDDKVQAPFTVRAGTA